MGCVNLRDVGILALDGTRDAATGSRAPNNERLNNSLITSIDKTRLQDGSKTS